MNGALTTFRTKFHALADPVRAVGATRFFKTGPGDYGEGDKFLGLTVPLIRSLVREADALSEDAVLSLLHSEWHDERLLALLMMVRRFERDAGERERIVNLYLANTRWVNNWDLVDTSSPHILGAWLLGRDRAILQKLAASPSLWEQRIAVLATFAFIRADEFGPTLALCEPLLTHQHDLMHKACGWMLREVGKRDVSALRTFLDAHAARMPRTMLRYSIEKFSPVERQRYLAQR